MDDLSYEPTRRVTTTSDYNPDNPPPSSSAPYIPLRQPRVAPFVPRELDALTETRAERIVRLQAEARALGGEMVEDALFQAESTIQALRTLTEAGDAIPDGLREAARTLTIELDRSVTTMRQIQGRASQ